MDWLFLFTSFHGRIGRQQFWIGAVVLVVAGALAHGVDRALGTSFADGAGGWVWLVTSIVLCYPGLALWAKRWHDRGKSGWWSLVAIMPIIGWLWALIELGFLAGLPGTNQYGADPNEI